MKLTPILLAAMSLPLAAQWLNHKDARTPRTREGKPNLAAPAPRASNGTPDLSGVWAAEPPPANEQVGGPFADAIQADLQFISKYALNLLADFKPDETPMRPEAAALFRQRGARQGIDIPTSHCLPGGVPFSTLIAPWKMIQTPGLIVMLLEDNNPPRQIHTAGRKAPAEVESPSWMGYSVGTWQGDTLVVDTVGFKDNSWLDAAGHPRSESMHITERFRRRDFGHMDIEMTFDDPKMYTRPFSIKVAARLLPDTDILEAVCSENERDRTHLDRK